MKKLILLFFALFFTSTVLVACGNNEEKGPEGIYSPSDNGIVASSKNLEDAVVVFHYQRVSGDYDNWNIWVWSSNGFRVGPTEGSSTSTNNYGYDSFGAYYVINLGDSSLDSYHASKLGYIYHKGSWEEKDISSDRFIEFKEVMANSKNEIHLFSFQADSGMYLDMDKTEQICEIKAFKINDALDTFTISCNCVGKSYKIFKNGDTNNVVKSGKLVTDTQSLSMPKDTDFINDTYTVEVDFGGGKIYTKDLDITPYYDTVDFKNKFTYTGELGVSFDESSTTFRLWAPISKSVSVELYHAGHPVALGNDENPGEDNPYKTYDLVKKDKGLWELTVNENLVGSYYTYTVTNGTTVNSNVVDPYAKAAGLNGLRGYIADFSQLNPEGWSYDYKRPYAVSDLLVYEMHIRDITSDSTWNGTEANRCKYLGVTESGTTYTKGSVTVSTGFDHIKELGINAVQLQPVFDQSNNELANEFNWGYNPANYNVLEGEYSSNPYDATSRIKEFKQMVMDFQNAGIEVIMDVVYNHMNGVIGGSFDSIVPGYYFRYSDGVLSNGSGCGNETASERAMYSKYMIDSTEFLLREYNLSGYRFDLMGLHDIDTMNKISANLKSIDSNIAIYGEPWEGGSTTLVQSKHSDTSNISKLNNIAIFNDSIRDGIKGGVFNIGQMGWIQGGLSSSGLEKSLCGSIYSDPCKQINYIACHDNSTTYDKLIQSSIPEENVAASALTAYSIVFTAEGIKFMLNGDEILRSKKIYDEKGNWTGEYSSNSYNLPDSTNGIRWDLKVDNLEYYNKFKELVHLTMSHKIFHFSTAAQTTNYSLVVKNTREIVCNIKRPNSLTEVESWSKVVTMMGNKYGSQGSGYTLSGDWKVGYSTNPNYTVGQVVTGHIDNADNQVLIFYQE